MHSFHYLLLGIRTLFDKSVVSCFKSVGLTPGQPKVLEHLRSHDGDVQKAIARACFLEPATLSQILDGMAAKGLIERRSQPGDRRTSHVFLTDAGREKLALLDPIFEEAEAAAFCGISEAERAQCLATMEKIYANLSQERSVQ